MSSSDRDFSQAVLLASVLQRLGYYVDIKVPLHVASYVEKYQRIPASDIDVLGIHFDADFAHHLVVGECKSGESDALEELLKLEGVRGVVGAYKAYFVKTRIHSNAREVGRRLRVTCFETEQLTNYAAALGLDEARDISGAAAYYSARSTLERELRKRAKVLHFATTDYWTRDYWENIHNLLYLLRPALAEVSAPMSQEAAFVTVRIASALGIAILKMCRDIFTSGIADLNRAVEIFLFGGPQERRRQERLADELKKAAPRSRAIPKDLNPPFTGDLVELVAYLLLSPADAVSTPAVFESSLRAVVNGGFNGALFERHDDTAKKLMKDICQFTLSAAGIERPHTYLPELFAI